MIDETDFCIRYARAKSWGEKLFKNWLIETILYAKECYYVQGEPFITDLTYDILEDELRTLDPRHPVVEMVGYDKVYHEKFINGEI